ncbi:hypothetical protein ACIRPK_33040 [Kitasatospora sp. NPDC101801]|uniref:hypothetical protein n=1 Tax=Kitasatospora sp. NPDC101801 TaxID=3364103 RepID=UPI0038021921
MRGTAAAPVHCEDPRCEEASCQWQLTPRTADLLHTALPVLADQAYDDTDELGDRPINRQDTQEGWGLFTRLPRLTFTADLQWRRRMARDRWRAGAPVDCEVTDVRSPTADPSRRADPRRGDVGPGADAPG